jgi:hypothetical protein
MKAIELAIKLALVGTLIAGVMYVHLHALEAMRSPLVALEQQA